MKRKLLICLLMLICVWHFNVKAEELETPETVVENNIVETTNDEVEDKEKNNKISTDKEADVISTEQNTVTSNDVQNDVTENVVEENSETTVEVETKNETSEIENNNDEVVDNNNDEKDNQDDKTTDEVENNNTTNENENNNSEVVDNNNDEKDNQDDKTTDEVENNNTTNENENNNSEVVENKNNEIDNQDDKITDEVENNNPTNENENNSDEVVENENKEIDIQEDNNSEVEENKKEDYKVIFSHEGYELSIAGGTSIRVSKLIKRLNINIELTDIYEILNSNEEVLSITPVVLSNDWTVQSIKSFTTEETIIIHTLSGDEYIIKVTDPAGDVPAHTKTLKDNGDGTYTLALTVTGDSEFKNKINVVVVLDISGSMNDKTEDPEITYTPTDTNANDLYGKNGDEYFPLTRYGNWWDGYSYWYNNQRYTGQRYIRTVNEGSDKTRLDAAKDAVNQLADTLLKYNGTGASASDVQIALITFSNKGKVTQNPTTNYDTFSTTVNNLTATGGTNWEDALSKVSDVDFNDSDKTFVIFVSDGDPTYRTTTHRGQRGNEGSYYGSTVNNPDEYYYSGSWHNSRVDDVPSGVHGNGRNDIRGWNYDDAVVKAKAIVDDDMTFYTIGAYGDVDKMADLTTAAYADKPTDATGKNFTASNTAALQAAFNAILEDIERIGIGKVSIVDGTTSNISAVVSHLLDVDKNSFKYYKDEKPWDDAPKADLNANGEVVWNLGDLVLENGVTYKVTFDVWPSQETLDLIADIKNGTIKYTYNYSYNEETKEYEFTDNIVKEDGKYYLVNGDDKIEVVDPVIKEYLLKNDTTVADEESSYTLRTNTEALLTFTDNRLENPEPTSSQYTNPDPVSTSATEMLAITKEWVGGSETGVDFWVTRDGEPWYKVSMNNASGKMEGSAATAIGIITENENGYVIRAKGHEYAFGELGENAHHWEIKEEHIIRPMKINGVLTLLSRVDAAPTDGTKYYEIDGKFYVVSESNITEAELTATNERRTNIDINKVTSGDYVPAGAEFAFNIKATSAESINPHDDYIWFTVYANGNPLDNEIVKAALPKFGTDVFAEVDEDGNETGTFYVASGTQFTINMQNGWNLRIKNILTGSTYEASEVIPTDAKYILKGITLKQDKDDAGTTVDKVDGTVETTGKTLAYTFENEFQLTSVKVTKVWEDYGYISYRKPITLHLFAGNVEVTNPEIEIDGLVYTFINLPKFNNGVVIVYNVTEDKVVGYLDGVVVKNAENDFTVTNKLEVVSKTVNKIWNDNKNTHPTITITLKANDSQAKDAEGNNITATLENGVTTYTFSNLPKFDTNGGEITYTVSENAVSGYSTSYSEDTFTITNTELTSATVKKVWSDANNQDGKRPTSLVVTLSNGQSVTLDSSNNWEATIENLPKYQNKVEIVYTWTEGTMPTGYSLTDTSVNGTVTTLTNSYTPEKATITVTKIWEDTNNQDGKRPTSVVFTVTGNDGKTYEVTLDGEGNTWTKEVSVDKYHNVNGEGVEVEFTVDEAAVTGYEKSIDNDTLTITNSYTPEKATITVTKVWSDNDNQDGKRPTSVTFTVTGNDGKTYEVTLDGEGNTWTKEVSVDKYHNVNGEGVEVEFTVDEASVAGYEKSIDNDTLTITNSYTPEKATITVTKVWSDNDNQDGKRPTSVTFTVTGNDGKTYEVTLDGEGNTWTKEVSVDKYHNVNGEGVEVEFTVDEASVAGYEKSIDNDTLTITNSYTPEKATITVTKIWEDTNNQDGKRPTSVVFTVTGNDGKTYEVTLDGEGNTWTKEVSVDKYHNVNGEGVEVEFTVDEAAVTGYEKDIDNDTLTITNSYTPEKATITVTKIWEDTNNQDGKRPTSVVFTVTGNDGKTYEVTLDGEGNTWTKEVSVDKYHNVNGEGVEVEFTVDEASVAGYEKSIDNDTLTITNSYTPEKATITVTKVWSDNDNQDGKRPTSVVFTVTGNDGKTYEVTLDGEGNTWTKEVSVDKYHNVNGEGVEVEFTVDEAAVTGYEKSIDNDTLTITNSYTPEKATITVTKVWSDNDNQDGKRPTSVVFTVTGNDGKTYEVTLDGEGNTWTKEVSVDKYHNVNGEGVEVEFTVDEASVTGYEKSIDNDTLTITNSYTPETTTLTVKKVWSDNDNQDGLRPDSLTVTLSNGTKVTLSEDNDWTATIENLPVYANGKEIEYTWTEETVEGYELTTSVDGTTTTLTNTHTPKTISVTVTKVWADDENESGKRPESIEITLLANGKEYDKVTLSTENEWKHEFTELPAFDDGEEIEYTVSEENVPEGYEVAYEGSMEDGFIVHNILGQGGDVTPPYENPQTGDNIMLYLITLLMGIIGLISGTMYLKKEN